MEKQNETSEQLGNPGDWADQQMKILNDSAEQSTDVPQENPPEEMPNVMVEETPEIKAETIGESTLAEAVESIKIPWGTVVILAVLCVASLGTGIYYWYTNYYSPEDYTSHVDVEFAAAAGYEQSEEPQDNAHTGPEQYQEIAPDEQEPEIIRPEMDPLPEFIELWEEYDNDEIVAVLTLTENEILVMQTDNNEFYLTHDINREQSEIGWAFLDYSVDLLLGFDHNMVVYAPVGTVLSEVIQEYASYDFFLANPTISFSTLYGNFDWEIFAFYIAPDVFPFMTVNHPDDDIWGDTVEQFTLASLYNTMLDVTEYDQIITIASPTEIGSSLYYVLQARMLRHITS